MDIKKLFKGVAVVIDDKINDTESDDLILKIVDKLKKEKIPLLKYDDIPDNSIISNFSNISFILLDWELSPSITDSTVGSVTGATETTLINSSYNPKDNIEFIKKLKEIAFVPIFIFSHLNPDTIINKLKEARLYNEHSSNYIFVKKKNDLLSDEEKNKLFGEIESWLKQTPSIYVLKEWENALNQAKNRLFWEFYNINHKWPSVLQKTFTDDGSDVNYELGNFIFKNIMARTEPIEFDEDIISISDDELRKDELRKVLEAERFINNDSLPPEYPAIGDLFELFQYEIENGSSKEKKKLFLNIRPDCDIIRDKDNIKKGGKSIRHNEANYNPFLYCLECEILKDKDVTIEKGSIIERKNSSVIPFVYDNKILKINFDKLFMFEWKQQLFTKEKREQREFNKTRIGRILPPYITAIQQKYSFYLQRQGLPAIPEKAITND